MTERFLAFGSLALFSCCRVSYAAAAGAGDGDHDDDNDDSAYVHRAIESFQAMKKQ